MSKDKFDDFDDQEHRCEDCGTTENVSLQEDPFLADVHNDHSLHYLCEKCACERAADV